MLISWRVNIGKYELRLGLTGIGSHQYDSHVFNQSVGEFSMGDMLLLLTSSFKVPNKKLIGSMYLPGEPISFIFRGYKPYFGG